MTTYMRISAATFVTTFFSCWLATPVSSATIVLDNSSLTGSAPGDVGLDETSTGDVPKIVDVAEIPGLQITVTAVGGTGGSDQKVNSTSTSLGIDLVGDGSDDSDAFDAEFDEFTTWQFNQPVNVTQLDFTIFDEADVFSFAGTTINFADLADDFTDLYDFPVGGLNIPANTPFTLEATTGVIGIEGMTLMVVPEPSSAALLITCIASLVRLHRRLS